MMMTSYTFDLSRKGSHHRSCCNSLKLLFFSLSLSLLLPILAVPFAEPATDTHLSPTISRFNDAAKTFGFSRESIFGGAGQGVLGGIPVTAAAVVAHPGTNFNVPVTVPDITGQGIRSIQFDIFFNQSVIVPQASPLDRTGTPTAGMSEVVNTTVPGKMTVVLFSTTPISGSGTLFSFRFTAVGAPGSVSPLHFENFAFNEGVPDSVAIDGSVTIFAPTLSVANTTPGAEAGTPNVFTVTMSASTTVPVTVDYTTGGGTATAGSDYTGQTGTITFAANTTTLTQTITVPTLDDNIFEGPENFNLTLSNPTNATIAGTNPVQGTIADNEGQPALSIANTTQGSEPGTANVFTVTLSGQTTQQVTVNYTTASGSATSGADFTQTIGTLAFPAGTSTLTQTISVPTLDDTTFEGTETFTMQLSAPTNATLTGVNPAEGTILDNEAQPTVSIANTTTGAEPGTDNVFTVTLSGQTASVVTVNYAAGGGTATSGADYTATAGTLTFPADTSALTQTITVPTLDDAIFEGTETFNVTLSAPTNATIAGTNPAQGSISDNEGQPTVSVANLTSGAEPGTANVFTITLSGQTSQQVTVNYSTGGGSATASSDYTPATGTITFLANASVLTQSVNVPTLDDSIFEGTETFDFTLSSPVNATIAGTNPAQGTIADNENQPTVSVVNTTPGAEPNTGTVFTVTLSGQTTQPVTVNYATSSGTATEGVDYTATGGTVTFPAGTSTLTQTVTVPTLDDGIVEGTENFNFTLSAPSNATISGANPALGSIADNESQPVLSVVNTTPGAEPGTANVFTVTLSNQTVSQVTVNYTTSDGSATAGSDYTATAGTLTFLANTTTLTQTITVPTLNDTVFEGTENFNLTLSAPTNATIAGANPVQGTIADNETQPTVSVANTTPGAEPGTNNVFTITLSGQTAQQVTVNYSTGGGTATASADYTPASGTVTFLANTANLTQTVSVTTLDDLIFEGAENFNFTLSSPVNASIAGPNPAVGTIADNDSQPTVSIANTTPGAEPGTNNVFTVTLSGQTNSQVTVNYASGGGTATAGSDYTAASGTLTFLAGTTTLTQTIVVPTLDDNLFEGPENFNLTLSSPTNATISGPNPAIGTIADNDGQPTLTVVNTTPGAEPGTAAVFTVTMSNSTTSQVTVNYGTSSGTATSGSDFTATTGTLTFLAGTTTLTQTISVPTLDDLIVEGAENFNLTLSAPTNATIAGTNPAVGTIADNESQPVLSVANTTAGSEPGTANVFTVTMSNQSAFAVTVNYATSNGSASAGTDYTTTVGTLTFEAGTAVLTRTITVPTLDDAVFEGTETFNLTLSAPTNATIAGTNPVQGTIADNELQPTLSVSNTTSGAEPGTANVFTVTLSGQTSQQVTVNYSTGGGTATAGSDYTPATGTLTFLAGTSTLTQTVNVSTLDDAIFEGSENFNFTLSSPANAALAGTNPVQGTIADNESQPTLSVANTIPGAEPGTAAVFTVTLSGQTTSAVTVSYTTSSGTAIQGSDYTGAAGSLTFLAGTTTLTQTISVPVLDDVIVEGTENFNLTLSAPTNATIAGTNPALGTIADNEGQPVVSITNTTPGAEPNTPNVFTVTLSNQSSSQVTVDFATSNGTATAGSDYTPAAGTITFEANTTNLARTITVATLDDLLVEGPETFNVSLSAPTNATIAGVNPAVGTIADNDVAPTPTPTPTPTPVTTPTPVATPTPSPTPCPGGEPGFAEGPAPGGCPTPTPTPTPTPVTTPTPVSSPTPLASPTPTPTGNRIIRAVAQQLTFSPTGRDVSMVFQLDSLGNESSASFSVNFNPAIFSNPRLSLGPGAPAGTNLGQNLNEAGAGRIGVLVDSTNTYQAGTRHLLTITWAVIPAAPAGTYPVTFSSVPTPQSVSSPSGQLLPTAYEDGHIVIVTTAAGVEVSGRVLTPDGRGLRNVQVSLVDRQGVRRTATTGSFGYYRFEDIQVGEVYITSVASRRFRFASQIVQVFDSVADLDLIALE